MKASIKLQVIFVKRGGVKRGGEDHRSEVAMAPPVQVKHSLWLIATCVLQSPQKHRSPRPHVDAKAFVAAFTPRAMMMPVVSNPSTAIKMATILDRLVVGRKSP
jgi:hypothetical protein